ncbi:hypothetical protein [Dolichospermum circinale]|uniref:hypothetical protein n=1 Tax=Dolichospermum circinale TaxID=109265 RepID=UPI00041AFB03|nr:hypothetical protein [Dolichospermum circinale]
MTCEFVFLPVGNADSIIIYPDGGSAVLAETSGNWVLSTQTNHKDVISTLPYPACQAAHFHFRG